MWIKLPLLEVFEYVQHLKLCLGSRDFNESANLLFAICMFLFVVYLLFYQIFKVCKKRNAIKSFLIESSFTETLEVIKNPASQASSNNLCRVQHFVLSLFNLFLDSLSQLLHSPGAGQGKWKVDWEEEKLVVLSALRHGEVQDCDVHHEWISHRRKFAGSSRTRCF